MIGRRVGNYVLVGYLGDGGTAGVYRALHPLLRREVAIKLLSDPAASDTAVQRFLSEAHALTAIGRHPNIIEIYDSGQTSDGRHYYVMELLEGQELGALQQRLPLSPTQALPFVEQICAALAAAHCAGVVHRDIKPGNIFVVQEDPVRLKLLDFGIARLPEQLAGGQCRTRAGTVVGTPQSMAPEQAAGQPDRIGPATDIYGVGVLLYWLLSGRPPFQCTQVALLLAKHIEEDPPALHAVAPYLPLSVCDVVHRCLQKDPFRRYHSAAGLMKAFKHAVAHGDGEIEVEVEWTPFFA